MNKFNWSLGLLTAGILLIITDVIIQATKPAIKKFAIGMGLTGTGFIIVGIIMLFFLKPQIKIS